MRRTLSERAHILFPSSRVLRSSRPAQLCLVDHELRFTPAFLKAREHVRAGTIGAVLHATTRVLFPMNSTKYTWWADASLGGGALGAIGSHVIDSYRWPPPASLRHLLPHTNALSVARGNSQCMQHSVHGTAVSDGKQRALNAAVAPGFCWTARWRRCPRTCKPSSRTLQCVAILICPTMPQCVKTEPTLQVRLCWTGIPTEPFVFPRQHTVAAFLRQRSAVP